jgi:hypothetical protein
MSHLESGPANAKFAFGAAAALLRGSGRSGAHKNTSSERGATRANQPWETRHQHRHRHPNATSPTKLGSSPARKYAAAAPRPSRLVTSAWFSRARVSALCAFRVSAVPTMLSARVVRTAGAWIHGCSDGIIPNMVIGAWLGISEVGNNRHEAGRTIRLPVRHRVLAHAGCAVQSNLVYSPRRKDLCCRHGAFSEADPFIFFNICFI